MSISDKASRASSPDIELISDHENQALQNLAEDARMVAGVPQIDKGKGIATSEAKGNPSENPHHRTIDLNIPVNDPFGPLRNGNNSISRLANEACENQGLVLGLPA